MAIIGAALSFTSLLAGCTGVPGEDVSPSSEQISETPSTPSPVKTSEGVKPTAEQVPGKGEKDPASPVPPPSGGDVSETVAPVQVPKAIETGRLVAELSPSQGLIVELRSIKSIDATAHAPGQVAGPALAVTIFIKNSGPEAIDVSGVEVSLDDANGDPGSGMIDKPAKWFEGSIDPGAEASGVYVFTVAKTARDSVRLSVTVKPGVPAVVFTGSP